MPLRWQRGFPATCLEPYLEQASSEEFTFNPRGRRHLQQVLNLNLPSGCEILSRSCSREEPYPVFEDRETKVSLRA